MILIIRDPNGGAAKIGGPGKKGENLL
jgi:hypothetical protein